METNNALYLKHIIEQAEKQGSSWEALLKQGYERDEPYYEFGIVPTWARPNSTNNLLLVLNHHKEVYFLPSTDIFFKANFAVFPSGDTVVKNQILVNSLGQNCDAYFIPRAMWEKIMEEGETLQKEYTILQKGVFFSIPNKWYNHLAIIQFVNQYFLPIPIAFKASSFLYGTMANSK